VNQSHNIPYLEQKFVAFGLLSMTLLEGNSLDHIKIPIDCLSSDNRTQYAKVIIADTRRGYGCPSMMEGKKWFHRAPNDEELALLSKEIDAQ
jgi:transketolase